MAPPPRPAPPDYPWAGHPSDGTPISTDACEGRRDRRLAGSIPAAADATFRALASFLRSAKRSGAVSSGCFATLTSGLSRHPGPRLITHGSAMTLPRSKRPAISLPTPGARLPSWRGRPHRYRAIRMRCSMRSSGLRGCARGRCDRPRAATACSPTSWADGDRGTGGDAPARLPRHRARRCRAARARGRRRRRRLLRGLDGPARAVRCGQAICEDARSLGLDVRVGLHTGEVELDGSGRARPLTTSEPVVAARPGPGEVLVSSTVKDLVAGSGLTFAYRTEGRSRRLAPLPGFRDRAGRGARDGRASHRGV